jgi:hypothetical protein
MNITTRKIAGLVGVAITMAGMGLTSAAVGAPDDGFTGSRTPRTLPVRGELIPIYGTPNYVVHGDLVGTWLYDTQPEPLHKAPTLYAQAGTEIFNGCVDVDRNGRCGRADYRGQMHTVFLYWASFDTQGNLLKGHCVHPITGGRGAFVGSRGQLHRIDTLVSSGVKTTYSGEILLNAVPSEGPTSPRSTAPESSRATVGPNEPALIGC